MYNGNAVIFYFKSDRISYETIKTNCSAETYVIKRPLFWFWPKLYKLYSIHATYSYCNNIFTVWILCVVGTIGRNADEWFFLAWRLTCFDKWSLRINGFWHTGHTNFFSPVCVRLCRDSSSDREKRRSQFSHLQINGFSPVWMRWWAFKWLDLK